MFEVGAVSKYRGLLSWVQKGQKKDSACDIKKDAALNTFN